MERGFLSQKGSVGGRGVKEKDLNRNKKNTSSDIGLSMDSEDTMNDETLVGVASAVQEGATPSVVDMTIEIGKHKAKGADITRWRDFGPRRGFLSERGDGRTVQKWKGARMTRRHQQIGSGSLQDRAGYMEYDNNKTILATHLTCHDQSRSAYLEMRLSHCESADAPICGEQDTSLVCLGCKLLGGLLEESPLQRHTTADETHDVYTETTL
ncbi:hypothetical protein Tco_0389367 [Tanacetum coccineum]